MKFIILGDIHIGKSTAIGKPGAGKGLNSRIQDQIDLLDWVLDTAVKNNVKHIFVTGDVYEDPKPHPTFINLFMLWLKRCEKEGVYVDIIGGNHDILRTGSYTTSALDIVPSIEMDYACAYKEVTTINLDGVSVTLVPYRDRRMYEVETTEEALELLKKEMDVGLKQATNDLKVCIGHLAAEGSISIGDEIDDELNEIFCPSDTFAGWDYTWLGHIHKPQVMHKYTDAEPYYVAHVGSMERSDFGKAEMNEDKIIILFDTESKEKFTKIKLPNRNIYKIEITVPEDKDTTDFIINHLCIFDKSKPLNEAIVKLEIQLSQDVLSVDREKVTSYLYKNLNVHYICYFSESRIIQNIISDKENIISDDMSPEASINAYWDNAKDLEDDDKEKCRAISLEINKQFEDSLD